MLRSLIGGVRDNHPQPDRDAVQQRCSHLLHRAVPPLEFFDRDGLLRIITGIVAVNSRGIGMEGTNAPKHGVRLWIGGMAHNPILIVESFANVYVALG
jgi:hypothetical protein